VDHQLDLSRALSEDPRDRLRVADVDLQRAELCRVAAGQHLAGPVDHEASHKTDRPMPNQRLIVGAGLLIARRAGMSPSVRCVVLTAPEGK
jgi:hypothetical protein